MSKPEESSNEVVIRRSTGMAQVVEQVNLARVVRWLTEHDDNGRNRAAYVVLTYQTPEHAADERAPMQADMWEITEEDDEERQRQFAAIGEKAWRWAQEYMSTVKIAHTWRIIRYTDTDSHAGMLVFKLGAPLGSSAETLGADPSNEKGMVASNLRAGNMTMNIFLEKVLAYDRMATERNSEDRAELRELRKENREMWAMMQDALDRKVERDVRVEKEKLELEVKKQAYELIGSGIKTLFAKHAAPPEHFAKLIETLDQETLLKMAEHLNPEQRSALMGMIQSFMSQKELARLQAEKSAKKEESK